MAAGSGALAVHESCMASAARAARSTESTWIPVPAVPAAASSARALSWLAEPGDASSSPGCASSMYHTSRP